MDDNLSGRTINIKTIKIELFNLVKNVDSINDAINVMKTIIPKYYYDFFGGALNWFALPIVTYIRTKYESEKHHSKDCREHCSVLRYIIENSKIKNKYFKTEILTFLSIKPFIKANHTILIAHWIENNNEKIDVFTPYRYYKTITKKEKKDLFKFVEEMSFTKVKYNPYYILNLF